jgi:hypothetical protein
VTPTEEHAAMRPRTLSLGPLVVCTYARTDFWVRLFGRGLSVEYPAHPGGFVPFSERYGYQRAWHVGGACIKCVR